MPQHFALFLVGSIVVTIVPGADMALITRQVVTRGRRAAHATIAGNLTGLVVHTAALVVGLSALLVASATAYTAVKLAGAAYLIFLGVQALRHAGRAARGDDGRAALTGPLGNPFLQGLISTVLNPKPALFFLSYLPQFVDRDGSVPLQLAFLGAVHILIGLVWLTFYAWCIARVHAVIARPRIRAAIERATGTVLIALGLRVAA